MKLLFDENVSPRLVAMLRAEYPDSAHLRDVGLRGADDEAVWKLARAEGFAVVSKDNDFRQRSFVEGSPPKVVWLDIGNDGTNATAELLRRERARLLTFDSDPEAALLVLSTSGSDR